LGKQENEAKKGGKLTNRIMIAKMIGERSWLSSISSWVYDWFG